VTKDELERIYLEGFSRAVSSFPAGAISKSENPDFLVRSSDHTIGIELTRLFRRPARGQSPLREQESLRERIAAVAKSRYDAMNRPPIHVSIHFNDQLALRKTEVSSLAGRLVELATRLTPDVGGRSEEEYDWLNRAYFPEQIAAVTIHRPDVLRKSFWGIPSADYVHTLSRAEVQAEIDKKNGRINDYRLQCERVWLILCSRAEGLSSYLEFADDAITSSYRTSFDRVCLYVWPSAVYDLAIGRGKV
jgi:hypothetical protein